MDAVSYSHSAKQAKRIKKIINEPDSTSGVVTVPKVISAGETITIPAGRTAVLPNVQVDGTLTVDGDLFVPSGATAGDLENQIGLKADTTYVNNKPSGFKNYIINGGFDIWQRGTSFTLPSAMSYTADRWYCKGILSSVTSSYNGTYGAIRVTKDTTNSAYSGVATMLEYINVKNLSYKTVTLSFKIKLNQAISNQATVDIAWRGAGDVADTHINSISFTNCGIDINSVGTIQEGKVSFYIGSAPTAFYALRVAFFGTFGTGTDAYDFQISQVQLEEGSVATPFEQRPYELELSLCQRYYEKSLSGIHWASMNSAALSYEYNPIIQYKVQKRVSPSLTLTGTHTSSGLSVQMLNHDASMFSFRNNNGGAFTPNDHYFEFIADAEL